MEKLVIGSTPCIAKYAKFLLVFWGVGKSVHFSREKRLGTLNESDEWTEVVAKSEKSVALLGIGLNQFTLKIECCG